MSTYPKRLGLLMLLLISATVFASTAIATPAIQATLYKNPNCDCCTRYAHYLEQHGFNVQVIVDSDRLAQIQRQLNMLPRLAGCHAMFVDGYVVDGLVPVAVVKRMLREQPDIRGITLPGMPAGAPGMDGPGMQKHGPLVIYAFGDGQPTVYATK